MQVSFAAEHKGGGWIVSALCSIPHSMHNMGLL